jgi:hypothetical protein
MISCSITVDDQPVVIDDPDVAIAICSDEYTDTKKQ